MAAYELSEDAEQDLRDVARYTLRKWGKNALQQYRAGLKRTFETLTEPYPKHPFPDTFPDVCVAKYRYHYIFYLQDDIPIIIGVIQERRDVVNRLIR